MIELLYILLSLGVVSLVLVLNYGGHLILPW